MPKLPQPLEIPRQLTRRLTSLTRVIGIKKRTPPGAAPGTLTFDPEAPKSKVRVMSFSAHDSDERAIEDPAEIGRLERDGRILWVNVDGLGDADIIGAVSSKFGLHPLAQEDVLNVSQRPKVDDYAEHLFVVVRMPSYDDGRLRTEQVSLFLGDGYVITFQERPGDCFDPIRERIRKDVGRIRKSGADYLAYALLDTVVDHCFPVLEQFGEYIDRLEDAVLASPEPVLVAHIHEARRDLVGLRRAMWPLRETLAQLHRDPIEEICEETRLYLRDAYDHAIQILDLLESYREVVSGLLDVYLSSVSNRMNEVMKVLTLIATIFIPLSFIAGVYGMNFNPEVSPLNMPELSWYFGYPFALGLMALTALTFLVFFVRRGWLGR